MKGRGATSDSWKKQDEKKREGEEEVTNPLKIMTSREGMDTQKKLDFGSGKE